jgi:hypothetical protein
MSESESESTEEKIERLDRDRCGLSREVDRLVEKRRDLVEALKSLLPGETDPIRRAHIEAAIKKDKEFQQ